MIKCTRKLEFDAAHRILEHEGKCKLLHGHRYVLEITVKAKQLDEIGRVVDFGVMKKVVGKWIDDNWDHNAILNREDKIMGEMIEKTTGQKIYYLDCNPTVENMADYLFKKICPKLLEKYNIIVEKIKLYETPNCWVEVEN
jgi:6-pyruvoyltetrahydropterin/6-carboxytetrahydropterin synthase